MSMIEMSSEKRIRLESNLAEFKKQRDFWQRLVSDLEKELEGNVEWRSDLKSYEEEMNKISSGKTINHIIKRKRK